MPSLEEVKTQLKSLDGVEKFLGRKEIKELPNILWEDEKVVDLVPGSYRGGFGILVSTNRRLIFIDKGILYGLRVEDFPLDKISSIQYSTGLIFGDLTIYSSGNKSKIENAEKGRVRVFSENVRNQIHMLTNDTEKEVHDTNDATTLNRQGADNILEKLERLAALKSSGILTEEEFLDQKRRILGS